MKTSTYPRAKFLTGLSLVTFLFSLVTFGFANPEPQAAAPPALDLFQNSILAAPNTSYRIGAGGTSIQLNSGRIFLRADSPLTVAAPAGTVQADSGKLFVEAAPDRIAVAVAEGKASLEGKPVSAGRVAQAAPGGSPDGAVLESLGMGENVDPALQQLAMVEPGSVLTSLALSEAAVGSSLLPVLGGTAAAAGVTQAVSSLVQADEDEDVPLPVSP